ncbi:MAG: phage tail sheath protein, partial [Acidobacteria bacterium]|nr:phage tail sheath protein [Acidobacteriota bacterium]
MSASRDEPRARSSSPWQRLPPAAGWQDLDLAPPALAALRELAVEAGARERGRAAGPAGAPRTHREGLAALFAGPPGTGKTLAAGVLAHELGRDLHRVDLAALVSKHVGETEKNLRELFDAAQQRGALLYFDEADALFGKRSEVGDAHDRYANLEVSFLLQRIDEFDGLVIFASDTRPDFDPDFLRRLSYVVEFPPPVPHEGEEISRRVPRPGVHVEEPAPGAHHVAGVATSIAAFVGRTASGPTAAPALVSSFLEFEQGYGGLALDCPLSYAVRHFFDNGGSRAVIARIVHRDAAGGEDPAAPITDADLADPALAPLGRGLWLLDQADLVNLLCIPPLARGTDVGATVWDAAIRYARSRRAFVIVDPPAAWTSAVAAISGLGETVERDPNAALYVPRLLAADPLTGNPSEAFAPCGAIAGIYARTDAARGVWKAPAGMHATLTGVHGLAAQLSAADCDLLNQQGINCLRTFPGSGPVVWGARTLEGADTLAFEWNYVPVRRLALFLEESIDRGTRWAASEPNAEPLWAELRLVVGNFLSGLWRQGAFLGSTTRDAYFVQCGRDTTTQNDLDQGV